MQNKMNNFEKLEYKNYMNSLYDIYGSLLTERQNEYFKSYYFLDYSLREIASSYNVSSNAVYDQIKNIEKLLENYENNLHILEKNNQRSNLLEEANGINSLTNDSDKINKFNDLIEKLKNI